MRTTLDIDDDVLLAAKERAARERRSIGAVLSALAREALGGEDATRGRTRDRKAVGRFALLPRRGEIVTLEKVRRLHDDEGV